MYILTIQFIYLCATLGAQLSSVSAACSICDYYIELTRRHSCVQLLVFAMSAQKLCNIVLQLSLPANARR